MKLNIRINFLLWVILTSAKYRRVHSSNYSYSTNSLMSLSGSDANGGCPEGCIAIVISMFVNVLVMYQLTQPSSMGSVLQVWSPLNQIGRAVSLLSVEMGRLK